MAEQAATRLADIANAPNDQEAIRRWQRLDRNAPALMIAIVGGKHDWHGANVSDQRMRERLSSIALCYVNDHCLSDSATHYEALGITPAANSDEVRDAWRRMIALVHPDTRPVGLPEDAASRVNRAYEVLSREETRRAYDRDTLQRTSVVQDQTPAPKAGARSVPARRRFFGWASRRHQRLALILSLIALPLLGLVLFIVPDTRAPKLVETAPRLRLSTQLQSPSSSALERDANARVDNPPKIGSEFRGGSIPDAAPAPAVAAREASAVSDPQTANGAVDARALEKRRPSTADRRTESAGPSRMPTGREQAYRGPASPGVHSNGPPVEPSEDARPPRPAIADAIGPTVRDNDTRSIPLAGVESRPAALSAQPGDTARLAAGLSTAPRAPEIDAGLADAMLRFAATYEQGSLAELATLLSPRMADRDRVLKEYDALFRNTTMRTLRLGRLAQRSIDGRVRLAGPATISVVESDQRRSEQRIFLEIDFVRDSDRVYIARLASYGAR